MAKVETLLHVDQGSDFSKSWRWSTKDTTTQTVTPVDLSGWNALCMIRDTPGPGGYLLASSVPVTLNSSPGMITLVIPASTSWSWKWKLGVYDIVLTNPEGKKIRFAQGRINLQPGVSYA